MQNGITRRGAICGLSAAPALGLLSALPSTPARAAGGWGTGPRSGLPFWLGCSNGEYDSLVALLPSGRSIDLANQWETEGPYMDVAVRNTTGWHNQKPHQYLAAGAAVQWNSSPFCSGSTMVVPDAWPSQASQVTKDYHLNCSRPPTYTGTESQSERVAKQRRVWQIAADGWLEPVWREKMKLYKRDYFIRRNLRGIRIALRACHELNTSTTWGNTGYRRSYGMMLLQTIDDYLLVNEALRRYFAVFLDVFGNIQPDITSDYAYADWQLWPHWNVSRSHKGPQDVRLTCPDNARLVGFDFYNFWPALLTTAAWDQELTRRSPQGWPIGFQTWQSWANSVGKALAIAEWGLMSKTMVDGKRAAYEGWDNPVFITKFLDFCRANTADIAYVSYFNSDNTASLQLPAHLIKTWPGIDDATACARTPPGDNNRCGARAFKQWVAAYG